MAKFWTQKLKAFSFSSGFLFVTSGFFFIDVFTQFSSLSIDYFIALLHYLDVFLPCFLFLRRLLQWGLILNSRQSSGSGHYLGSVGS